MLNPATLVRNDNECPTVRFAWTCLLSRVVMVRASDYLRCVPMNRVKTMLYNMCEYGSICLAMWYVENIYIHKLRSLLYYYPSYLHNSVTTILNDLYVFHEIPLISYLILQGRKISR
jgi:hypothetical protein